MSFTALDIGDNNDNTLEEWKEVFDLLDPKDGVTDGQIDKSAFIEWIDTLSFQVILYKAVSLSVTFKLQDTVMLEARNGISRGKLKYLINSADVNDNNFIDKLEFLSLVQKYSSELEKIQKNNFHKYLRIAAYAEEYR